MKKFWTIFRQEYAQVVQKKSFLFGVFLTPALMALFTIVPSLLITKSASETEQLAIIDRSDNKLGEQFKAAIAHYKLPDSTTPYYNVFKVYEIPSQDTAQYRAIYDSLRWSVNNKVLKYVMVFGPNSQIGDTNFFLVTNSENFVTVNRFEKKVSDLVSAVRLADAKVNLPVDTILQLTRRADLTTKTATGESLSFGVKYISAMATVGIMFAMIMAYGTLVMRSIIEEKNSRIMEVMVSSVSPFQLMMGKILGLGAATLTQVAIWVMLGVGLFIFRNSLSYDQSLNRILFSPAIIIFFALYLMSGYMMFSTLFALIGSVVSEEKEAQNFIFPITMSMVLPFMLAMYIIQEPNSNVAIALSLIPFLTPSLMVMRLLFIVPTSNDLSLFSGIIGQAIIGLIIVWITTIFLIWATSKVFRIGILMYGKRPTLPEILKWVKQ